MEIWARTPDLPSNQTFQVAMCGAGKRISLSYLEDLVDAKLSPCGDEGGRLPASSAQFEEGMKEMPNRRSSPRKFGLVAEKVAAQLTLHSPADRVGAQAPWGACSRESVAKFRRLRRHCVFRRHRRSGHRLLHGPGVPNYYNSNIAPTVGARYTFSSFSAVDALPRTAARRPRRNCSRGRGGELEREAERPGPTGYPGPVSRSWGWQPHVRQELSMPYPTVGLRIKF
jgi:hypothetical protein